jgi:hypothetical protein
MFKKSLNVADFDFYVCILFEACPIARVFYKNQY